MKKSIIFTENKKAEITEVRQLEENQQLMNANNQLPQISIPKDLDLSWVSKNTHFTLSPTELAKLKTTSEKVFKIANETLLEIVKKKEVEPWMNSRYGAVKSLWKNSNFGLSLMRIDFAWDQEGNLKVLELNTSSQTGWILNHLAEKEAQADKVGTSLSPQPFFYSKYMLEKLGSKVAIICPSDYNKNLSTKELNLVAQQIESLGGECKIFCLSETTIAGINDFAPSGLFWRCDSLVGHAELVLKLSGLGLPQLPSFEALFIAGDKSFLNVLKDKTNLIPKTYVLSKDNLAQNLSWLEKDKAVLKPGDFGNGEGIEFGKNFSESVWRDKVREAMESQQSWVIQERCYLQKTSDGRYEDISVYVADGVVQGFLSRISTNEIVNISNGGFFQPTVLLDE